MEPVSLQQTYARRHVLVTGASGFLGKVWLALALDRLPEIGRLYVLMRKKGVRPALERFEEMVGTSPVFRPLHERHGAALAAWIAERVEVVDGDLADVNLVADSAVAERLQRDLDLVINCAGLVDFNPDVRQALDTNVDGTLHVADFAEACDHAALLHVSTCYVAGSRQGRIEETCTPDYAPQGKGFDAASELADLRAAITRILTEQDSPELEAAVRAEMAKRGHARGGQEPANPALVANVTQRLRQRRIKKEMVAEGTRRAAKWGWPNTYTYTKSLAESLLLRRADRLRLTLFRPAIVESAVAFPFPGWNEGFNTSAPLVYMLGTWFRQLPAKAGIPFDVVPVDQVANAIMIAGAATLLGQAAPVYQCGTSDRNPITLGRACELTALGHRKHLRARGATAVDRVVKSRWDAVTVEGAHLLSVPNLRGMTRWAGRVLRTLAPRFTEFWEAKAQDGADVTDRLDRQLHQMEELLILFKPFVHDNRHIFACRALETLPVVEDDLRFRPETIDWRAYWIDVHMPGLRRWCYPQFEGKQPEKYRPAVPFKLPHPAAAPAAAAGTPAVAAGAGAARAPREVR